jgi:hypothetical protein
MVIHYNGKLATMPCSTPVAINQGRDCRPKYTITEEDVDNYLIRAALSNRLRDIITAPDVGPPDHPEHQISDVIGVVALRHRANTLNHSKVAKKLDTQVVNNENYLVMVKIEDEGGS